ncbi:RNA polymerase sigma factor [Streptosporangium sp. NPDC050855]|uniref:RNA polymerase sigma factor n=1 Tax=Streptosporangium sp. NPDC050855 TaxID=3366194 RepID=UPI003798634E
MLGVLEAGWRPGRPGGTGAGRDRPPDDRPALLIPGRRPGSASGRRTRISAGSSTLTSRGGIRPWLYGIATNLLAGHRRNEVRRRKTLSRAEAADDQEGPEGPVTTRLAARQVTGRLAGALAGLAKRDRDVVLLLALGGLSHAEVAAALGIPYGTVASRLNRARKQLRKALGDANPLKEAHDG